MKKLNLDNCHSVQISGLTDDYKSLLSLSIANVGLTSLKGFPNLPNLRKVLAFINCKFLWINSGVFQCCSVKYLVKTKDMYWHEKEKADWRKVCH